VWPSAKGKAAFQEHIQRSGRRGGHRSLGASTLGAGSLLESAGRAAQVRWRSATRLGARQARRPRGCSGAGGRGRARAHLPGCFPPCSCRRLTTPGAPRRRAPLRLPESSHTPARRAATRHARGGPGICGRQAAPQAAAATQRLGPRTPRPSATASSLTPPPLPHARPPQPPGTRRPHPHPGQRAGRAQQQQPRRRARAAPAWATPGGQPASSRA
jgi:hypothetical protein